VAFDQVCLFENPDVKKSGGANDIFSKIRTFRIKAYQLQRFNNGLWDTFYSGDSIGACKKVNLPGVIKATKIRLKILRSEGFPSISHFAVSKSLTRGVRVVRIND